MRRTAEKPVFFPFLLPAPRGPENLFDLLMLGKVLFHLLSAEQIKNIEKEQKYVKYIFIA
ncbi:Uncharacterized protein dnm_087100 [Desulfonema magnum]|uniref:Uncharacterized protein n=1 Tax=Desulfonema magnum TaxID=45655 RepID=A0A975GTY8_9BACT|nr:Uncharacterized protein dnm_087100 [Desulfonema magnum]